MDFTNGVPIYIQIAKSIKEKIALGQMKPGDKVPSIREIASMYKVNPNTVQRSTQILEEENIIYSKRGIGSFVVEDEKLIQSLKNNLANEYREAFLANMAKIGVDRKQALAFLMEEENGR